MSKAESKAGSKAGSKAEKRGRSAKDAGTAKAAEVLTDEHGGRPAVLKTYKLFVGGKFPRSESGRVYRVTDPDGTWLANPPLSSRKDARDAVVAARKAFPGWSGATAYNRGQVLYRVAEMLEGRREQFASEVARAEGLSHRRAVEQVETAVDRWVWYAGWADKLAQVVGNANPVAGPYFNLSVPEPTGVVAVFAPAGSSLLGAVSVLAPVIVSGNTAVLVADERTPLPALSLAEVLATSDVPGGVVNVLSGRAGELGPPLAAHRDVNAIDLTGIADADLATELEREAAENLKRVVRPVRSADGTVAPPADVVGEGDPGTSRMTPFLEIKTVWHPMGV
ncbi:aldehyde dehydrogenase family protein [Streptomyces alkaliphilus]|uniref:aldehyde dehydrogenase family protein n=1 Tax=Streptomyces alkaliphilus TaxID=1472722 RepID=UPI00117E12E5|nr:aldehyde dehydrogenase family protein [Streptomyces alkaliphilus]MQS08820.1 aldehyde dehydrogenase family protein [Streptomyces alkaliphilus]